MYFRTAFTVNAENTRIEEEMVIKLNPLYIQDSLQHLCGGCEDGGEAGDPTEPSIFTEQPLAQC
jgi:hypothetical protein